MDAAHPVYQDISSDVTTSGTISSANITTYTGAINATINDVNIKPGQTIKKGDLLLTYDTASLEDQYNEASLTARSSRLTNQATVDASNKTSADITQAQQKADSLKSQIAAIQAEITNLRNTDTGEDPNQDLTASLAEKRTRLDAVLNEIQTILDTKPAAEDLAKNQDYINKCNERDTLTASIANLEAILKTLPDNSTSIMAAIEAKNAELSDLQTQLSQQEATIDSAQADVIKELGFGESLVMLILTALLAIIIIICGFFIIYTVYFRFLKILIIVPLGAIACSTMAGNRMVSHTMSTYCKYFLSCVFEAVTMALAIVVCNAFINAGLPSFTGSYADWAQTLIYLCEMTFTIAMTVGSVKGAQTLTSKAFGL